MTDQDPMSTGIDTRTPNVARIYDYLLGGKDNISQVVLAVPYSGPTVAIQALQAYYSKTASFAVRHLSDTSLGANVCFARRVILTLA